MTIHRLRLDWPLLWLAAVFFLSHQAYAATTFSCDIAAAAGTPCVAAYSMARPLFASYSGYLFKLQRASDHATRDIGIVNGLADVATANSFCQGTTCTFIVAYDQTSYHLDAVGTNRSDSSMIPHPPTYTTMQVNGITVPYWQQGYLQPGSRANSAWGNGAMPVGSVPVTVYAFAGNQTGGCCYDFGEAEATIADTGNGHMFTLFLDGSAGASLDMENGGVRGDIKVPHTGPWVSFGKTDGVSSFSLKWANLGASLGFVGNLTAKYCPGTFTLNNAPLSCWGYAPMHLEGGLTIGDGGDGSGGQPVTGGAFIEGVVIAAQTSDATDDAIQSGINQLFGGSITPPPPKPVIALDKTALSFTAIAGGANPANQTVSVSNSANNGTTLAWNGSPNQTWLSLSPTSGGNGPTAVTVSINIAGRSAGTYNGTLTFVDPNATPSQQTVSVTLNVGAAPPVPVRSNGAPTGTLAAGTVSTTLSLNTDVAASCKYATVANTAYSAMTNTFTPNSAGTTHTAAVNGLANGQTYNYYVRCINSLDATKVNTSDFLITFAVNTPGNQPPMVGAVSANPSDVDLGTAGVQEYEGTQVTYSATVSDPNNDPLTWQWYYTSNGGARIAYGTPGSGAGPASVSFNYPIGTAGSPYVWIVHVSDGQTFTEQSLTVEIISQGTSTPPPLPALNLSGLDGRTFLLSDEISFRYPVTGVMFSWAFAPNSSSLAAPLSSSAAGAGRGPLGGAPFATTSVPRFTPSSANLTPGTYQMTVTATQGTQSVSTSARVTFVSGSLSGLKVYPNPWRSDRHAANPSVTFEGLTIGTTIKLFTISGHEMKELHTDGPSVVWDLTNDKGDKVASGMYLYAITDTAADKVRGKVAVIK